MRPAHDSPLTIEAGPRTADQVDRRYFSGLGTEIVKVWQGAEESSLQAVRSKAVKIERA